MNIALATLHQQYREARTRWPYFHQIEQDHGLPSYLLFAVGSRETGLRAAFTEGRRGDPEPDGHGHGVWQLDDRWHIIPNGFDLDAHAQAEVAAGQLEGLYRVHGDWLRVLNAYNSGSPDVTHTTGNDYGPDVWARRDALLDSGVPVPPVDDRPPTDPNPEGPPPPREPANG